MWNWVGNSGRSCGTCGYGRMASSIGLFLTPRLEHAPCWVVVEAGTLMLWHLQSDHEDYVGASLTVNLSEFWSYLLPLSRNMCWYFLATHKNWFSHLQLNTLTHMDHDIIICLYNYFLQKNWEEWFSVVFFFQMLEVVTTRIEGATYTQ